MSEVSGERWARYSFPKLLCNEYCIGSASRALTPYLSPTPKQGKIIDEFLRVQYSDHFGKVTP